MRACWVMRFPSILRLTAGLFVLLAHAWAHAGQPNVLIIQTDEHNFRTLGCYRDGLPASEAYVWGPGIEVLTPHIDRLAREGVLCDRFYATSPVCTPSRAALMSGLFPQNTGAIQNDLPMKDSVVTFAEVLRRKGYATGYAGKWHLDGDGKPQFAPERRFGFEDNRHMFNRGHWKKLAPDGPTSRVAAVDKKGKPSYGLDDADATSFTTDYLTDRALEFIDRHAKEPFCYMLSLPDPHGPNTVRAPYDTMYLGMDFQMPASAQDEGNLLPPYAATLKTRFQKAQMALYFGMVKCIDDNVGRMLQRLSDHGILDHTIVIFTSDHGDLCGEHGRQNKGVPMEASARIPFMMRAPGLVPAGSRISQAMGTVDFKPTLLGLLGVDVEGPVEGRDLSGVLAGRQRPELDVPAFVRIGGTGTRANGWFGAFTRKYKFVMAPQASPALFDLEADPQELNNRFQDAGMRPVVRRLSGALRDYARRTGDPLLKDPGIQKQFSELLD